MPARKASGQMVAVKNAPGIYRRNGRYVVKWWEPSGNGSGRRRQEALPEGTTLAEAKGFKADMERQKRKTGRRDETCDAFAERWARDYPRREDTTNTHNAERVRKFGNDFAGVKLRAVDAEAAHRWALANQARIKAVKAMFSDAVKYGFADENPFAVVTARRERGRADIVVPTEAEIETMLEIALDRYGWFGPIVAGLIGTAAWTGMRPGELFALRPENIDFDRGEVHVLEQVKQNGTVGDLKTHEQRVIALLPQAEGLLKAIPRHPASERVFYTKRGEPFNARIQHYYWDPVRAAFWAQLPTNRKASNSEQARRLRRIPPDFDFYELRHFAGSYLANVLKLTPYDIARQMGHADGGALAMRLYIHTEQADSNERVRQRAQEVARESAKKKRGTG